MKQGAGLGPKHLIINKSVLQPRPIIGTKMRVTQDPIARIFSFLEAEEFSTPTVVGGFVKP